MCYIKLLFCVIVCSITVSSCGLLESDPDGPNVMGGDANLEMTKPGSQFDAWVELNDLIPAGYSFKDSIVVTRRDNGIVTMDVNLSFDASVLYALDTLAGTSVLPMAAKLQVLDVMLKKYGATIDTSTPGTVKLHAQPTFKITADGIQEYVTSGNDLSKPFTVVKYNMNVGDTWDFTDNDGVKSTRKVVHKSTVDEYPVYFWLFKVTKVESVTANDPLIQKITFVTNHKYGTLGAVVTFNNGKEFKIGLAPPTL